MMKKGATINPENKNDDNCFQYAITVALNHQNIRRNPKRKSKIKPFIIQYHWEGIEFPTERKDWKKFEQNNETIALSILYFSYYTEQICCAHKSGYNNERENQVILLMITDGKKWHYFALKSEPIFYVGKLCNCPVKSLSRLLRRKTSNYHGDFYCLNCFNLNSTENRLKEHEELGNKHDSCRIKMPWRVKKILKYNHGESH